MIVQTHYNLQKLSADIINLSLELLERPQRELGWIEAAFKGVTYSDQDTVNEVKESTRNLSSALSVLYLVVVVEDYFPPTYTWTDPEDGKTKKNLWEEAKKNNWLTEEDYHFLRAYRHIRHTYAHSQNGCRANQCYDDFDKVMNSNRKIQGIRTWDQKKIIVTTGASIYMANDVKPIFSQMLSKLHADPDFT